MPAEEFLTSADISSLAGIAQSTWSAYVARGQAPEPDHHAGRTPLWSRRVIELWLRKRHGRSGRPGGDDHWQRKSTTTNLHAEWRRSVQVKRQHRIYLAGKIAKNDWRHEVVENLAIEMDWKRVTAWPLQQNAIAPSVHYTGPHFIGCDHGCAHGENTHGRGDDCSGTGETAERTLELCLKAVRESTAFFAWLDDPSAYGTLVEIGYAKALNIPIAIGTPPSAAVIVHSSRDLSDLRPRSDMWFALTCADVHIEALTPQAALAKAISTLDNWDDPDDVF